MCRPKLHQSTKRDFFRVMPPTPRAYMLLDSRCRVFSHPSSIYLPNLEVPAVWWCGGALVQDPYNRGRACGNVPVAWYSTALVHSGRSARPRRVRPRPSLLPAFIVGWPTTTGLLILDQCHDCTQSRPLVDTDRLQLFQVQFRWGRSSAICNTFLSGPIQSRRGSADHRAISRAAASP